MRKRVLFGVDPADDFTVRGQRQAMLLNVAEADALSKAKNIFLPMLASATSLEQLRSDFLTVLPKADTLIQKYLSRFGALLTKATSLDQLRQDVAIATGASPPSFIMRKYGGVPVWGWGAIGVGGGLLAYWWFKK